jgi:ubiquinone/menaquinone biosynthesis C-methylase UbiE
VPSVEQNLRLWGSAYGWEKDGDEWAGFARSDGVAYPEWKASVLSHLVRPYVSTNETILEIGCGHGRWSEELIGMCRKLYCVDLAASCLEYTRARLAGRAASGEAPTFIQTSGPLPQISDGSVDFVWSFDVFVHMDPPDIATYLEEFRRVLKPGGVALLHHADDNRWGGWRSNMTAAEMRRLARKSNLVVAQQFDCWGERLQYSVKMHQDVISVVRKHAAL